jgi:hypothetical protein
MPFRFIPSRSRVIVSSSTLPLTHHQYAHGLAVSGTFWKPWSRPTGAAWAHANASTVTAISEDLDIMI